MSDCACCTQIVVNPDVAGNGALDGVAQVVFIIAIAIRPAVHRPQGFEVSPRRCYVSPRECLLRWRGGKSA